MTPIEAPATPAEVLYEWFSTQRWTDELYLALAEGQNALIELSNEKVVIHTMPTPAHQELVTAVASNLRASLQPGAQARVLVAPTPVRLWEGRFREPDVLAFLGDAGSRVHEQFVDPPDLAVEVSSPSSRGIDSGEKLVEYARAGIREYWLVDGEARSLTVYRLVDDAYRFHALVRGEDELDSPLLPGLRIRIDALLS